MASKQTQVPVLIVGGGPTGMALALWLNKFQVPFRIVDRAATTGTTSRALVVHARTLELYRQLGIADEIVENGTKLEGLSIHHDQKSTGFIPSAEAGKGLSRYPFFLSIPQDAHERILEKILTERGVKIERRIEVEGLVEKAEHIEITLRSLEGGKEETVTATYVAGCDGAHSVVRHALGIPMEGGTYAGTFFVADVDASKIAASISNKYINMCLSDQDFNMVIPLKGSSTQTRLIGFVPSDPQDSKEVSFDDVLPTVERNVPLQVDKVNWFSYYKVQHRTAGHFQQGNVFLLGDACHLHSPVGGQGMNTGLGDAANLAWKVATAVKAGERTAVLDTYEEERIAFAKKLVGTTDAVFTFMVGNGFLSRLLRNWIAPYILPRLVNWLNALPTMFRRISQIEIEYRHSRLSQEIGTSLGTAKAGDRLPWVPSDAGLQAAGDNFEALALSEWQGYLYGEAPPKLKEVLQKRSIAFNVCPWKAAVEKTGLAKDVLYLVRPDGYIGLKMAAESEKAVEGRTNELVKYLDDWRVGTQSG